MMNTIRGLLVVTIALMVVDALYLPAILGWVTLDPVSAQTSLAPGIRTLDTMEIGLRIFCYVTFSAWLFAAGKNLVAIGYEDLEFSPSSRVWWFFVPFANLVMPYRGMAEMWRASHGDPDSEATPSLVAIWWAIWLGGNILMTVLVRFSSASDLSSTLLIGGTKLLQAIVAIALLVAITRAQARLRFADTELEEVFT